MSEYWYDKHAKSIPTLREYFNEQLSHTCLDIYYKAIENQIQEFINLGVIKDLNDIKRITYQGATKEHWYVKDKLIMTTEVSYKEKRFYTKIKTYKDANDLS